MPLSLWVGVCFVGLYTLQVLLAGWPGSRWAQALYPWVYGGFYLDERFTRLTFHLWPARVRRDRAEVLSSFPTPALKGEQA